MFFVLQRSSAENTDSTPNVSNPEGIAVASSSNHTTDESNTNQDQENSHNLAIKKSDIL